MNDPKRLSDAAAGSSAAERAVLQAGLAFGAPSAMQAESVRSALAARLPGAFDEPTSPQDPGGQSPSGPRPGSATVGASGVVAKASGALAVVVLGGLLVWAGRAHAPDTHAAASATALTVVAPQAPLAVAIAATQVDEPPTVSVQSLPLAAPQDNAPKTREAPAKLARSAGGSAVVVADTLQAAGTAVPSETARPHSRLVEESLSLAGVREALRSGEVGLARSRLADHSRLYPAGSLEQERRALEIEVLRRSGDREAADRAARAFLADYPGSPHAAAVRADRTDR